MYNVLGWLRYCV